MSLLADPDLMAYPKTVVSAPCMGCKKQIDLTEPQVFTTEAPLDYAAQDSLRAWATATCCGEAVKAQYFDEDPA